MRIVIATCSATYTGRLTAHLPEAVRMLVVKADGSVLVHADSGAKPLNYMGGPARLVETGQGWTVTHAKTGETLTIVITEVHSDIRHDLGAEPGLIREGVEKELQALLADRIDTLGSGLTLVRREFMTPLGPVDFLCRDADGGHVAVEIKRHGGIDGVEQLTRYLEFMNRDPLLGPVRGLFAAQTIAPQARVLATDRGIECRLFDYDALKGTAGNGDTLF